jgi:2-(1,2-epoxy-1,2-dihydrophenyl)acetyl-CoA isomerase
MSGTDAVVKYECRDSVAWISLDDPSGANGMNTAFVAQLREAVMRARDDNAAVVVLRTTGRFFSVGGDLAAFGAAEDMSAYVDDLADGLHRVVSELTRLDAIVVSVVQGMAAGAGFPLAAAADIVLASRSARFTLGYTKVGLSVDGGTSLLSSTIGLHRVLRLALLNDVLSAEEAHAAGLVAQVHDDEELESAVNDVVARLLAGSRTAQAATKHLIRGVAAPAPETAMRKEALSIRAQAAGVDGPEGVRAFLEKRPPRFSGR